MTETAALSSMTAAYGSKAYSSLDGDTLRKRAMATAQDFESVYIADAFKDMFKDVSIDPLSGPNTNANSTWRDMLIDEYAKDMVKRGGIGIASSIAKELIAIQEKARAS
jgi:Rod binding domain-containing protein